MNAKQAMDSRRFCMLMDDLAVTWKKRGASDEDKEFRLAAVFEFAGLPSEGTAFIQPQRSLSEVMAQAVDEFKNEAPPKGFPPPSEDERFKQVMDELTPTLERTQPNGKGERLCSVPLEVDMTALTGWLDGHKEYAYFVDLDHTINVSPNRGDRSGWIVPFKKRGIQ